MDVSSLEEPISLTLTYKLFFGLGAAIRLQYIETELWDTFHYGGLYADSD